MDSESIPDEGLKAMIVGHLLIRDVTTGEVLINQRDNSVRNEKDGSNASD